MLNAALQAMMTVMTLFQAMQATAVLLPTTKWCQSHNGDDELVALIILCSELGW